jgi:hypothetical protein
MTAINAALQSFNAACPNPNRATLEQFEALVDTVCAEATKEEAIGNFEYIQAAHACVLSTLDEAGDLREQHPDGWRRLKARVLSVEGSLEYRKAALLIQTLEGEMDADSYKAFKVCADFAVVRYREVAELQRALGERDLLARSLKVLGEACLLAPARRGDAAPALEEALELFKALPGDHAADVGAIEGHLSKVRAPPPPPPAVERAAKAPSPGKKKKKGKKKKDAKEPDAAAAGAAFLAATEFVVVVVGDAECAEGAWDMAAVRASEAAPGAEPGGFRVGGACTPPLPLAGRADDASLYLVALHRPRATPPRDWRVLAHAGHRVTVAQLRAQAPMTPVRSGCSEPEHPVCFGVGDGAQGRCVQFASFSFDDAILALASEEVAGSAADDAGSAVWRVLAANPIAEFCARSLVRDLKDAERADAAEA